jgi:hypothetical protein
MILHANFNLFIPLNPKYLFFLPLYFVIAPAITLANFTDDQDDLYKMDRN